MPIIKWNSSMSVKNAEIDLQHQKLIKMINALHDAMLKGQAKDLVLPVLKGLISYTAIHFKYEEDLFKKYSFPQEAAHIIEHRKFVKQVQDFKTDFQAGKIGLSIKIMNFLSDWLKKHILDTDKKYVDFFASKGLR